MGKSKNWLRYEARIRRVSDHIHAHLDDALNMDKLAQIACLSPYHWHRIYRAIHGETITATVKRLRLQRAASELTTSKQTLAQIARRAGYSNLQSFNRTFKQYFGTPPGQYRRENITAPSLRSKKDQCKMYDVTIASIEPIEVWGIDHQGAYRSIGKVFETLNAIAATRGIHPRETPSIGIYYDDPCVVPEKEQRAFVALPSPSNIECKSPLKMQIIAGGEYAVFQVKGPYSNAAECYEYVYGDWLKSSNRELGHHAGFTKYLNPFEPVPEKLETQIYLPLIESETT